MVLKSMVGKAYITMDTPLKAILVKAQKKTVVEKASIFPQKNLSGHEHNVHGNMKRAIGMRSQK